jgi:hypothetical protein
VRGFQFQPIDLRRGVPGEAALDHRTMQICFEELGRAQETSPRPNFPVLLGDRYGWRPLAETVTESEFRQLEQAAQRSDAEAQEVASTSATQVLHPWYRRDDNSDPAEYILRSRQLLSGNLYFNPSAFASGLGCGYEVCGVTGSAKQYDFSGPGAINTYAGLEKDTKLTERTSFFLRVEMFNVFNHANFLSSGVVGNANAGSAFGQATTVSP